MVTTPGVTSVMGQWPLLDDLRLLQIKPDKSFLSALSQLHGHQLHSIELGNTTMTVEVLSGLVLQPLPLLRSLGLVSCGLRAQEIAVLVTPHMPKLAILRLDNNMLDTSAVALLASASWPQLQMPSLSNNRLDNASMSRLSQGPWAGLHHLCLDGNDIDATGIEALQQGDLPVLWQLDVGKAMFCSAMWQVLGLAEADLPMLTHNRAGDYIQVQRNCQTTVPFWSKLRFVNFVTSQKGQGRQGNMCYLMANCMIHTCLYMVNVFIGNLPIVQLASGLQAFDVAAWQLATVNIVFLGLFVYVGLILLLVFCLVYVYDTLF